jgi:chromosome segregation ATPase
LRKESPSEEGFLELIAFQATPSLQKEGLPYWIFWFLLCVILLLLFFIFLRNKQLRMRLSSFLAGARRRSLLLQLRIKIKKEGQKKADLLKKLGAKAWDEDIPVEGSEHIRAELEALFEKKNVRQAEWKRAFSELEKLHKKLADSVRAHEEKIKGQKDEKLPFDDLMKRKKDEEKALKKAIQGREMERQVVEVGRHREETQKRIDEFEAGIKEIEAEGRSERREIEKEIRYLARKKEKVQEKIKEIEAEEEELHLYLGRIIEEQRVETQVLVVLYAQIDDVNQRISTLQHRIETLTGA